MSDPSGAPPPPPPPPPPSYPPPGPPQYQPPSGTPGGQPYFPPGSPGYMPPPIGGTAAGPGMLFQFTGPALWSIIAGIVSIVVPFFTNFYLPVLPLIGLFYGVQAIRRGRPIGGIVGIVLCVIGGIVALLASGIGQH